MAHLRIRLLSILLLGLSGFQQSPADPPRSRDPRLVIERFAAAPDIVHPIALDFDARGRLLVVESHTHFRPAGYTGPRFDRIRILEDTDGDGRADRFTTYFEGTTATMDLAVHPDGAVYVATRNEVLRLRDTTGDGIADERTRIAFLETTGNYPHNGLGGLAFDSKGGLVFGMGENLGEPYKLIGADGTTLAGGGEGGNVYRCTADGKQLRRIATGFWNPFGAGFDIYGRLFVVDNDPDQSPPCRLIRVVEGGDYGFQFRYGRSGRHPFQAWNGELYGTLPMVAGTGESPCEIIAYESNGLPAEYRGQLLSPIWADHRIERYMVRADGLAAERHTLVQGGGEFRPSGLAVAPDGSLFVSDWVSESYELHGKGAVWRVRWKDARPVQRPRDPKEALASPHRPIRDAAARVLARDEPGRTYLREQLATPDVRIRAAVLTALLDAGNPPDDILGYLRGDPDEGIRELVARRLAARGADLSAFTDHRQPVPVRTAAMGTVMEADAVPGLLQVLGLPDPYLRHAAIRRLAELPQLAHLDAGSLRPEQRAGVLLALRASRRTEAQQKLPTFLGDSDPTVRLLAAKWVADEKLTRYRSQIATALERPGLDPRNYLALATALGRLDNRPVNEDSLAAYFQKRLADRSTPLAARLQALRAIPATHSSFRTADLVRLLEEPDERFRVEVLRYLTDRGDPAGDPAVKAVVEDASQPVAARAQGIVALARRAPAHADRLVELAVGGDEVLAREAWRSLVRVPLTPAQRSRLEEARPGQDRALAERVLRGSFKTARPSTDDLDGWSRFLDGPADAEAGRRVFEHPAVGGCAKCHRVDGRGGTAGPDLSLAGRTERAWLVQSLVRPGAVVAPHYQTWKVDTADGQTRLGLLVRTYLDVSEYVDGKGERFSVRAGDGHEAAPVPGSIMPDNLVNELTDQELRDLLAYLASRR